MLLPRDLYKESDQIGFGGLHGVRNAIEEPQQSRTTHAEVEPTTAGEPSQSQTVIDPKSGATATNLCELRPATKGRRQKLKRRLVSAKGNLYCSASLNPNTNNVVE